MPSIYIVDDHPLVLEGIRSLLENQKDITIVGWAGNARECLAFFVHHTADIILMDIHLPDINGIDLCGEIKQKHPGIMVLGLSTFQEGSYIKKMMEKGASGYVLKNAEKKELLEAIYEVYKGKTYLSFDAGKALKQQDVHSSSLPLLSRREKEVLVLIADGYTNPEIAEKLFVSSATVDTHRKNLMAKLNVKNTAMLIRFAVEHKLLS